MIGAINIEVDETISRIVDTFYSKKSFSDVTSSYWKENDNNLYEIKNNIIELKGAGSFGDFSSNNLKNQIRHYPELVLTNYLLKKYGVDKKLIKVAREICRKQQKLLMFDSVKQLIACDNLIKNHQFDKIKSFCVIGDGFGFLTTLLSELYPEKLIIDVNLGRQLLYDYILFKKVCPQRKMLWVEEGKTLDDVKGVTAFLPAENYHILKSLDIQFFFNMASMQEMDMSVIRNYFDYMRNNKSQEKMFYCCNRESKKLPDGSVINFDDYGWGEGSVIFDQYPEWYKAYPSPRPPMWRPFDGVMRERLFKFK